MSEKKYLRNSGDKNEILTSKFYYISSKWTQGIYADQSDWSKPECPIHSHEHYEIMLVQTGDARFITEDEEIPIYEGSIIVTPPGIKHKVISDEKYNTLRNQCGSIRRMLISSINTVKVNDATKK